MKYYIFADITFFEYVSYFSSNNPGILSAHVPLPPSVPLPSPEPIMSANVPRSLSEYTEQLAPKSPQVFTRRPKVPAPPSTLDSSLIAGPPPQQFFPF